MVGCGVLTLLLAAAAGGLAVWCLRARRTDRDAPARLPVGGLVLGAFDLFCGAGLIASGSAAFVPADGTPRQWRAEEYRFEVTVPSERWEVAPNPNVLASFRCPRPLVMAIVAEARPAETNDEYEAVLAYGRKVKADTPTTGTDERTGANRHGHDHWLYMGEATSGTTPYFFGVSITRVNGRAVLLMFEGQYRLSSGAGRAQEAQSFRAQADRFLGSVK